VTLSLVIEFTTPKNMIHKSKNLLKIKTICSAKDTAKQIKTSHTPGEIICKI
jgi:hypothetical protein